MWSPAHAQDRQMDIHDHRSGLQHGREQHGFFTVDGFPDDGKVIIGFDHLAQKLANVRMVVDEQNSSCVRRGDRLF